MPLLTLTDSKKIIECIQHGVIITDLKGRISYSNSAADKIFGYKRNQLKGKYVRSIYGDEDVAPFKKVVIACFRGESVRGKWHGLKSDGTKVWLDVRARIIENVNELTGCVISVVEIDKLIHAEERLKKNEALARNVFETSTDAIITFDNDGKILSCNRAVCELFGYEKKELEGQLINLLLLTSFNETVDSNFLSFDLSDSKITSGQSIEMQGKSKTGKIFPIELTVGKVEWKGTLTFTGIIRNLTARRNLERRILQIGQEERRKIGRDLHDGLGQMLTGIRMLSENLAKKLKMNRVEAAKDVEEIAMMIRESDEFARKLARGMVQVDLEKKGLSVALGDLCSRTEKLTGVRCEYYDFENAEINDHNLALHLYRIAQEAINNSIKHGKPNRVQVRLSNNEHHTALSVVDDGDGFSVETEHKQGSGIEIMRHRARVMGGVFEISRTTDELTQIRCVIPNNMEQFN